MNVNQDNILKILTKFTAYKYAQIVQFLILFLLYFVLLINHNFFISKIFLITVLLQSHSKRDYVVFLLYSSVLICQRLRISSFFLLESIIDKMNARNFLFKRLFFNLKIECRMHKKRIFFYKGMLTPH